ncbi:hypothetical protein SCG7086_BG_00090 [Chlamydiales bacterium SCGC AG-110-P3]|nr:hypothetical protein SCG7086_BG_00090 [Chlamydiales bacterium SCGC AG-110-P3]
MYLLRVLILFIIGFSGSLLSVEAAADVGGQPASGFLLNKPTASGQGVVHGNMFPYTIYYDPAKWEMFAGNPGDEREYTFSPVDGSQAQVWVEFRSERVHYQELPQNLIDEVTADGLSDVQIELFEMLEVNGKYYIFIHMTADTGDDDKLMGYIFHYLTDAGMLRLAFVTLESEGDVHDQDFQDLLFSTELQD